MTFKIGDRVHMRRNFNCTGTINRPFVNGDDPVYANRSSADAWWINWDDDRGEEAWAYVSEIELTDRPLEHSYAFNATDNGGEALTLVTKVHNAGEIDRYVTQELHLQSYGRSTTLALPFDFTPSQLRELADQLEQFVPTNDE